MSGASESSIAGRGLATSAVTSPVTRCGLRWPDSGLVVAAFRVGVRGGPPIQMRRKLFGAGWRRWLGTCMSGHDEDGALRVMGHLVGDVGPEQHG
jgi:hypothetical protein